MALHECLHCQEWAKYVVAKLEEEDPRLSEKLKPRGSGKPISKAPSTIQITEDDIDTAIALFEELLDALLDVLRARPMGDKPTEDEPIYDDIDGDWEWYYDEHRYENVKIEAEIDPETQYENQDLFLNLVLAFFLDTTSQMILKEITIQQWVGDIRKLIKDSFISQYLFAIGGKNVIDSVDINNLKLLIKSQFSYLQKFAEEIKSGDLTGAKILQRIGMYGEAITHGYEQAKAKSHGIKLPEYPADGNQQCFTNCRCRWVLEDDKKNANYVKATWTLNPNAEHCVTCVNNSRKWNPLRVKKGA